LQGVLTVANYKYSWLCYLTLSIKEEACVKYINANTILPDMLVEELQKYVQAGYIYIPAKDEQHKSWGELSGYRKELAKRNAIIIMEYKNGVSVAELADRYFLSVSAIRKIIYQK
jgi:Mor family transcriptional regulator